MKSNTVTSTPVQSPITESLPTYSAKDSQYKQGNDNKQSLSHSRSLSTNAQGQGKGQTQKQGKRKGWRGWFSKDKSTPVSLSNIDGVNSQR